MQNQRTCQLIIQQFKFLYDANMQSKVKCNSANQDQAKYVCSQKQCTNNPFMCQNKNTCSCYENHQTCNTKVLMSQLIEKMKEKTQKIVQIAGQQKQRIEKIKQYIINELNQTKNRIQQNIVKLSKKNIFASEYSLIDKLSHQETHNHINSKYYIYRLYHENQQTQLNTQRISMDVFIKESNTKWKQLQRYVSNQLINIQKSWNNYIKFYKSKILREQYNISKVDKLFQNQNIIQTQLLYRASQNDFQLDRFHDMCNNIENNILLVKTKQNAIIGAYTPLAWNCPTVGDVEFVKDESQGTFIFSLANQIKLIQKNPNAGIRNSYYYAPQFGTSDTYDFGICSKANQIKGSFLYFRGNFKDDNEDYKEDNEQNLKNFLNTVNNVNNKQDIHKRTFLIQQWEVWKLILKGK